MAPLKNPRLAWCVALASLALWATSVPLTWSQHTADTTRMLDVTATTTTNVDDSQQPADAATPCPPAAPAPAAPAASSGTASQGSFHLCGPDASTAQAIEQLIAGRSFSASLSSTADGCADLIIRPTSPVGNGSATSKLSVSLGSGQSLQIQITSQNGATHVSIGSGQ